MGQDRLIRSIAGTAWHVAVIGGGPAGCVAAGMLAGAGRRVLLVEKSAWPREKVCGGCLNQSAIQTINAARMGRALVKGQRLDRVIWRCGGRELSVPMPIGVAMLRSELDEALSAEAVERGCTFVPGVSATVLPGPARAAGRSLLLRSGQSSATASAEVVLACDGIGGTSVETEPWARWRVARRGWIGVAATIDDDCGGTPAGAICMHIGAGGYAGMVRLADGRIHLAAALDPRRCRSAGGAVRLVENILGSTGISLGAQLESARLRGTGVMTRRRHRLGGHRVLAVGDAGGYVEPFSGEGMAWAVRSAALASAMVPEPGDAWPGELPRRWESALAATIGGRQRWCRVGRAVVHHRLLASVVIGAGSVLPWIARGMAFQACQGERGRGGKEQLA